MRLGYNTNGLAHHDLIDALELLADLGYRSVAITMDHGALNPFREQVLRTQLPEVRATLIRHNMSNVIETGARYLLNPRVKHEPTLMSEHAADRQVRIDFLCRAIDIAAELQSDCVSCWSGILRSPLTAEDGMRRLCDGLRPVLEHAERRNVVIGFEPEPGMFIATMADFAHLLQEVRSPMLQLTLDVGHLHCQGELPISDYVRNWSHLMVNVHIEDMRRGRHEHLMFGEGEMQFDEIIASLVETQYQKGLHVELSRHSYDGPAAARQAFQFLAPRLGSAGRSIAKKRDGET
jgi:sugar phosphate isomerase/epimerase